MRKPHKHADLIKAWADGAEIEFLDKFNEWRWQTKPAWNEEVEYRIKPELKPDVVHSTRIVFFKSYTNAVKFELGPSNLKLTFDGETGELKSAEVLK